MDKNPQTWIELEASNPVISVLVFDKYCENCLHYYEDFKKYIETIPPSSACFVVLELEDLFSDFESKYHVKDQVPVALFIENGQEKERILGTVDNTSETFAKIRSRFDQAILHSKK